MLSISLRISLSIALIIYFFLIIIFLKKKALSLRYTLLWIFAGIMMGILIIFPQLLKIIILIVHIQSPMNGLFALSLFFVLILLMSITSIVSKQSYQIKRLAQDNALLEKRIREMENKNQDKDCSKNEKS